MTLTSPEDVNAATAFATPTRIDDRRRKGGIASASHTSNWHRLRAQWSVRPERPRGPYWRHTNSGPLGRGNPAA